LSAFFIVQVKKGFVMPIVAARFGQGQSGDSADPGIESVNRSGISLVPATKVEIAVLLKRALRALRLPGMANLATVPDQIQMKCIVGLRTAHVLKNIVGLFGADLLTDQS
jgi:hypothetical protein